MGDGCFVYISARETDFMFASWFQSAQSAETLQRINSNFLSGNTPSQGDLRRLKDFKLLWGCSVFSVSWLAVCLLWSCLSNDIHCLRCPATASLPPCQPEECVCLTVKDFWRFEFPHKNFSKINIWKRKALFLQNYKNKVSSCFCLWMICSLWHEITLNKLTVLIRSVCQSESY